MCAAMPLHVLPTCAPFRAQSSGRRFVAVCVLGRCGIPIGVAHFSGSVRLSQGWRSASLSPSLLAGSFSSRPSTKLCRAAWQTVCWRVRGAAPYNIRGRQRLSDWLHDASGCKRLHPFPLTRMLACLPTLA